jgi:hypothetical protein
MRERLKVQSIIEEMQTYHENWREHVERMQDGRFPKLALKYQPVGKRTIEVVPKNRWKDHFLEETGSINLVNSSGR